MQELAWPDTVEPFFEQQFNRLKKRYLEQSLFLTGSLADKDALIDRLDEDYHPDWECNFGPNGVMLGWLHPALEVLEGGGVVFSVDMEKGDLIGKLTTDTEEGEFAEDKQVALIHGNQMSFSVLEFSQAKLVAALAGKELLPDKKFSSTFTAEMHHYYDDIPSPVYTVERKLRFVRMWRLEEDPELVEQQLTAKPITLSSEITTQLYWDARIGTTSNKTFLMSSLIFVPPPEISTTDFYSQIEQEAEDCLEQLAKYICSLWNAELATLSFWQSELGFRISKDEITGNPWIITTEPKQP